MTGDQSIQDLQSQVASLSGKITQIQQSLGTGGIVMQVKSELSKDYIEIIDKANGGISNILVIFGLLVIFVGGLVSWYVTKLTKEMEEKEKRIKDIQESLRGIQSDIKQFINDQSDDIFDRVMQKMTDYWFDRLEANHQEWENLSKNIYVLDEKYVRSRNDNKNYTILLMLSEHYTGIWCVIYQFFPELILLNDKIDIRLGEMNSGGGEVSMNYHLEVINGTEAIIGVYLKDNSTEGLLVKYLKGIYQNIILENKRGYQSGHLEELKIYLQKKMKQIGKESLLKETTIEGAVETTIEN